MSKNNRVKYYRTSGGFADTSYRSFSLVMQAYIRNVARLKDNDNVLQSLHNWYAKKLKIPAVKLECLEDLEYDGLFDVVSSLDDSEDNVFIKIGKFLEYENGLYYSINVVLHETKHAHQAYIYHKFQERGIIPGSQHEKMLLLFKVLCHCGALDEVFYCSSPEELDSYIFEINEMLELGARYSYLNNENTVVYRKETIFKLLYQLEYNKEGVNNKLLKEMLKVMKKSVYFALKGCFGEDAKQMVQAIYDSGFDLESSFNYIVENLNKFCDELISDDLLARQLWFKTNLAKHGNIVYSIEEDCVNDQQINPESQYAKFLVFVNKRNYATSAQFVNDAVHKV